MIASYIYSQLKINTITQKNLIHNSTRENMTNDNFNGDKFSAFLNEIKNPWGGDKESKPNKPTSGGNENKPLGGSFGGGSGGKKPPFGGGNGFNVFDIEKYFKAPNGGSMPPSEFNLTPKKLGMIAAGAVLLWLSTGFFTVAPEEQGVVLRFGEYNRTVPSGLDYHLPKPFEQVIKVPVTKVNSVEVGFRSGSVGSRLGRSGSGAEVKVPEESLMITGDTNIADVSFEVQWIIKDAEKFLFNVREPELTVKAVSESAMREIIGRTKFAVATGEGRQKIETEAKEIIQNVLNTYDAGIEIVMFQLRPVQNPGPVMDAFLDVETAKQDKETAINKAKAYANDIIPRARGDAEKQIQDAEAYKGQVIAVASGEAQRFAAVLKEYSVAKDVTKQRIYLETMQQILTGANKVVIDNSKNGGVVPYLPLQELKKKDSVAEVEEKKQ
jgi:membrane protease subunit HflK